MLVEADLVHFVPLRPHCLLQNHVIGGLIIHAQDEHLPMYLIVCQFQAPKGGCAMEQ